ncbi:hypothetical protein TNCV_3836981 [Trichonephila clavipes]|nr:hypothetical protein TNCV_3836981 [Trichonephila clavipes]
MGRSDAAIRSRWQEWVDSGRYQRHGGSGCPRFTSNRRGGQIDCQINCHSARFIIIKHQTCVLTIIEDVSGDAQGSVLILLSLLHATEVPQPGVMVWGAISFVSRIPLVIIGGTLTAQRCVDDILRTV